MCPCATWIGKQGSATVVSDHTVCFRSDPHTETEFTEESVPMGEPVVEIEGARNRGCAAPSFTGRVLLDQPLLSESKEIFDDGTELDLRPAAVAVAALVTPVGLFPFDAELLYVATVLASLAGELAYLVVDVFEIPASEARARFKDRVFLPC